MPTDVRELTTGEEVEDAVPILRQLWTDRPDEEVRGWRDEEDYHLLGVYEDGDLRGVAGLYLQVVLHHQHTAWLHDMVVDEDHRSEGYGAALLDGAKAWADEQNCDVLGLVSRVNNPDATAFYEREGMERFGYVYECEP